MNPKITYLFMRGVIKFFTILKSNFLSFVTLVTVLFIYHIFWMAGTGTAGFLNHISNANTIRVYLTNNNDIIAKEILHSIKMLDNVSSAKYYNQKEAKKFAITYSPKAAGLESFAEEFFPSFIEIIPSDTLETTFDNIVQETTLIKGVDEVSYGKEYIAKFKAIGKGAWLFIASITILFAFSLIFVVYNTIKLSLYKYREEIKLYSLVGAERIFISMPYIFGALFLSLFAYICSVVLYIITFSPFNSHILIPAGINIYEIPNMAYFVYSCIIICIICIFAANVSISSFLKLQVSSINED